MAPYAFLFRWRRATPLLLAWALLAWTPAHAVTIYFNAATTDPVGYGIDAATLPAAQAALPAVPGNVTNEFIDPSGTLFQYTVPRRVIGNPLGTSRTAPSTASNTWTVGPVGESSYNDLWIVFRSMDFPNPSDSSDPNNGYVSQNVGLEITAAGGWGIYTSSSTGTSYPAFYVGDIAPGETATIPMAYRVAQNLFFDPTLGTAGEYVLPRLLVGYVTAVPEPSTLILLAGGLFAGLAARRRRS